MLVQTTTHVAFEVRHALPLAVFFEHLLPFKSLVVLFHELLVDHAVDSLRFVYISRFLLKMSVLLLSQAVFQNLVLQLVPLDVLI